MTQQLEAFARLWRTSPVFVVGERRPALRFAEILGDSEALALVPPCRLLDGLTASLERTMPALGGLGYPDQFWRIRLAAAYGEVQAAAALGAHTARTVEYSAMPIRRIDMYFPAAQYVVVHNLSRERGRTNLIPVLRPGRLIEVGADTLGLPTTSERVLRFLQRAAPAVQDLADQELAHQPS